MSIGSISVILSQKKQSLTSLIKYTLGYVEIYEQITEKTNPDVFDNFLYKVRLPKAASNRRLQKLGRIEKAIKLINKKEKEAENILKVAIDRVTRLRDESANNNKFQIGSIVRLAQQLEIQKVVVKAVIEKGEDTIQFVREKLEIGIPEEYLDWTNIKLEPAYATSDLSITARVQHQEKWLRIIDEIQREKTIASDLRTAEILRGFEFLSEQVCNRLLNEITREKTFMKARFKYLCTSVEYRELAKIEGFFIEKLGDGTSLKELEGEFKQLISRVDEPDGEKP